MSVVFILMFDKLIRQPLKGSLRRLTPELSHAGARRGDSTEGANRRWLQGVVWQVHVHLSLLQPLQPVLLHKFNVGLLLLLLLGGEIALVPRYIARGSLP